MGHYLFICTTILVLSCLAESKSLWSTSPAGFSGVIRQAYPLGNGRLGAMPFGPAGAEKVVINVDSLWTGGPFEISSYTGGNPTSSKASALPGIRDWIFQNGVGNVSQLLGSNNNYGSYSVLGNLSVVIDGVTTATSFNRSLNLDNGIHTTTYVGNDNNTYTSSVYCSYPDQVCVYDLSSSAALPQISISLENNLAASNLVTQNCSTNAVRLSGITQLGPPTGMKYDSQATLISRATTAYCSKDAPGTLIIPSSSHIRTFTLVIGAGTNYDQKKGNAANSYSFKGDDPAAYVTEVTGAAAKKSETTLRHAHTVDYQSLMHAFILTLPDPMGSANVQTSELVNRYIYTNAGDPWLESLLFMLGRHLFISSERQNSLPTNLAGRWSETLKASWGADYHSNINFQMNHWGADQTGLGELQAATWNYMEDTWVPRGTETANLLYGAPGWVTHDEMNIFGHTAMKSTAQWANYPASAAWMMQHVWDNYEYSQDLNWLSAQGYPLLKGHAQFWLSQLQPDKYSDDGTLVVNPCNSPEHGPTTFGCTHYQQLLHQMFTATLTASTIVSDPDTSFISNLTTTLSTLDKGVHISDWGSVQEWKLTTSDTAALENSTHRHLSNLVGWHPGTSISGLQNGYTNATIQSAVRTTLESRGLGNGPDANAGWEKVWRAACWAMLNDTAMAYTELKYAIDLNFAGNGLSMYSGTSPPFQIDANYGIVGAMLAMMIVDLPLPETGDKGAVRTVVLGPAIPSQWGPGSVKGLRLRGGGKVDFSWGSDGVVGHATLFDRSKALNVVNVAGKQLAKV